MDDVNTFFISKELTGKKYPFAASLRENDRII